MWIYIFLFVIVVLMAYQEISYKRFTNRTFAFIMVGLALFVGLADMLGGYDRYIYAELFDEIADMTKLAQLGSYTDSALFNLYVSEWGYGWVNVIISFVTKNRYIFIFILTAIIYYNLFKVLKKYTTSYAVALMFFMAFWFFFTFTYLRQVLAVTFYGMV